MGRPLWFVAGAGVGVYAAARARRAAESLTADGLRDRVARLAGRRPALRRGGRTRAAPSAKPSCASSSACGPWTHEPDHPS